MRGNRKPERFADEGRIRTYRLVPDKTFAEPAEFNVRLLGTLHYSRQASHVEFATTPEGYVEQKLTTDMALPDLGADILVEDITADYGEE